MKHLKTKEVADRFNITVQTVKLWRRTGKGPKFLRIGDSIRYKQTDVEDFENANQSDRL